MVASTANATEILVYKTQLCGCCTFWADHLEAEGFDVEVENHEILTSIKASHGVHFPLQSCHAAIVGGYVIEGHVPAEKIYVASWRNGGTRSVLLSRECL